MTPWPFLLGEKVSFHQPFVRVGDMVHVISPSSQFTLWLVLWACGLLRGFPCGDAIYLKRKQREEMFLACKGQWWLLCPYKAKLMRSLSEAESEKWLTQQGHSVLLRSNSIGLFSDYTKASHLPSHELSQKWFAGMSVAVIAQTHYILGQNAWKCSSFLKIQPSLVKA